MSLVMNDIWRKSTLTAGGVYKFTKRGDQTFDFFGGTDCPQRAVFKQDLIVLILQQAKILNLICKKLKSYTKKQLN